MKKYSSTIMLFSLFCLTNSVELRAMDEDHQETPEQSIQSKIQSLEAIAESKIEEIRSKPTTENSQQEFYLLQLCTLLSLLKQPNFHLASTIAARINLEKLLSNLRDTEFFTPLKEILSLRHLAIEEDKTE